MPITGHGDKWLQNFVPYIMYRLTNQFTHGLRGELRNSGINITRWRVLSVLRAYGEVPIGRIVELTVMQQPSVSRVVTQLENEGLVKRTVSGGDSRFVHVKLTGAGEKVFQSIYPSVKGREKKALRGFSRREITELKRLLRRIRVNMEEDE